MQLKEVVKEALRWGVLALVSVFVSQLLALLPGVEQTPSVELLTIGLRFVDATLHKSELATKGLVRF